MTITPAAAPIAWDTTPVGGAALRSILDALGDWEPERAVGILGEAHLERARFVLPPAAADSITHAELSKLYESVHARFGESLTRSFLTAHGRALGERLKADAGFMGLRRQGEDLSGPERLTWAVRAAATLLSTPGNVLAVEESRDELLLTQEHCSVCARIASARSPLCASVDEALTGIIRDLSGVRATAIEVECHAMGAPHCRYRVRR
jgi:predicted hydrocarbon binding protein